MNHPDHRRVPGFSLVYIPFGLLLVTACLVSEVSSQPTLRRAVFTIWLTVVTATPAVVLFVVSDLRTAPRAVFVWWRRVWTFSFTAFVLHLAFGHTFFEWNVSDIIVHQGWLAAGSNYLLAILWTTELALVWGSAARGAAWTNRFHWAVHLLFVGLVFTSTVLPDTGTARVFGGAFLLVVGVGLLLRLGLGAIPSHNQQEAHS